MSVNVKNQQGSFNVTNLAQGQNSIPHGQTFTPSTIQLLPDQPAPGRPGYGWSLAPPADDTNIYVTVTSPISSGNIYWWE